LVLARELAGDPPLVVVEQPTRGLDIAASAAIHERLLAARDKGAAVVVVSADLDELLMLADRLLVTFGGRVREVARDRDEAGRAMLGLDTAANSRETVRATRPPL
jgi:simple sugar transport system ATP-binding protein